MFRILLVCLFSVTAYGSCPNNSFPAHLIGDWYSIDQGKELQTEISAEQFSNELLDDGGCYDLSMIEGSMDAQGNYDAKILIYNRKTNCYQCYEIYHRTINVLQYKKSTCVSPSSSGDAPTLEEVCRQILPNADLLTMFRIELRTVNCKVTWEGTYRFTYEVERGGGGICDSPGSAVVACQEPGSVYVDNQVFSMFFGKCPMVTTSVNQEVKFQCMGTWYDDEGNIYSAMADIGRDQFRERFRCMLTRKDQQYADNTRYYALSRWAECSTLRSPYEGPYRLQLWPAYIGSLGVSVYGVDLVQPGCNFPRNFTGTWYTTAEFDSDVVINNTHIYLKTKIDEYTYQESIFTCQQQRDSRYLVTAVTVGRCEVDHICYDFMPRHHNIIRWRMSKPYRVSPAQRTRPDWMERIFRQACTWSSFTLNRDEAADWRYYTFILNPPAPVPCPIGGRYSFIQEGAPEELFTTRIRGITERPRHLIDCMEYVSEFKSCDNNPKKIYVDAEYCATLDHTAKPIGEYDIPDRELNCVGYWLEDMKSYMITFDLEDAVSNFRCWVYERLDWRDLVASRSITANCGPNQTAFSKTAAEGASLHLVLKESERLWDSCPQRYNTGENPYEKDLKIFVMDGCYILHGSVLSVTLLALSGLLLISL